jgi:hypothetical protein
MQKYERESRLRQSWRNRKNENIWASMILILTLSSSRTFIRESEQRYSSLRKFKHYKSSTSTSRRLAFERKRTRIFLSFEKKARRTAKQETTEKRENILLDVASWDLVRSRVRKRGKYGRKIGVLRYQCYWSMSYERSENSPLYAITRPLAYLSWVICLIQLFVLLIDRCASPLEWA